MLTANLHVNIPKDTIIFLCYEYKIAVVEYGRIIVKINTNKSEVKKCIREIFENTKDSNKEIFELLYNKKFAKKHVNTLKRKTSISYFYPKEEYCSFFPIWTYMENCHRHILYDKQTIKYSDVYYNYFKTNENFPFRHDQLESFLDKFREFIKVNPQHFIE